MIPQPRKTILIVDDVAENIKMLAQVLKSTYRVVIATSGAEALRIANADNRPDLILLDIMMPVMDGYEVCTRLKNEEHTRNIPIIFVSAMTKEENEEKGLSIGAVDYIFKPFSPSIVRARIKTHLDLKDYQDNLENKVQNRTRELRLALDELHTTHEKLDMAHKLIRSGYIESIYRLTLASEFKDEDTGDHIKRVSYYSRELADALGMNKDFMDTIFHAAPMHDVGKVGIPDEILLKPGKLTPEEWDIMKRHTSIGGSILEGSSSPFLKMAAEIASYHHERWSGGGYPNNFKGEQIPLAARIMNITDQYDALRSKRPYKPGFPHEKVMEIFTKGDGRTMPDHFDPAVLVAFKKCSEKFRDIFETYKDLEDKRRKKEDE